MLLNVAHSFWITNSGFCEYTRFVRHRQQGLTFSNSTLGCSWKQKFVASALKSNFTSRKIQVRVARNSHAPCAMCFCVRESGACRYLLATHTYVHLPLTQRRTTTRENCVKGLDEESNNIRVLGRWDERNANAGADKKGLGGRAI